MRVIVWTYRYKTPLIARPRFLVLSSRHGCQTRLVLRVSDDVSLRVFPVAVVIVMVLQAVIIAVLLFEYRRRALSSVASENRGDRKRPTSGWASLTPTERDVVRLVSEGLANKDIAARLFVSPRTVQAHLTHVYTKLGLTSRVQLAQEAARHA